MGVQGAGPSSHRYKLGELPGPSLGGKYTCPMGGSTRGELLRAPSRLRLGKPLYSWAVAEVGGGVLGPPQSQVFEGY